MTTESLLQQLDITGTNAEVNNFVCFLEDNDSVFIQIGETITIGRFTAKPDTIYIHDAKGAKFIADTILKYIKDNNINVD